LFFEMEALSGFASSVATSVTNVASTIGQKVEKLADDYQVSQKLNGIADASEERFAIISGEENFFFFFFFSFSFSSLGTYKKLVVQYLTALANGKVPEANILHDNFVFTDEHVTLQKDAILSPDLFRGRRCAGTVELFSEGATFGFKVMFLLRVFPPSFLKRCTRSRKQSSLSPGSRRVVGGTLAENVLKILSPLE
jgi:hypothetical protein